jgi:hypothetical protein
VASSRGIDTFIIGMPHRYVGITLIFFAFTWVGFPFYVPRVFKRSHDLECYILGNYKIEHFNV